MVGLNRKIKYYISTWCFTKSKKPQLFFF